MTIPRSKTKAFTLPEIARSYRVSTSWLRGQIRCGRLRAYKPARSYLVFQEDLEQFLDQRRVQPDALEGEAVVGLGLDAAESDLEDEDVDEEDDPKDEEAHLDEDECDLDEDDLDDLDEDDLDEEDEDDLDEEDEDDLDEEDEDEDLEDDLELMDEGDLDEEDEEEDDLHASCGS